MKKTFLTIGTIILLISVLFILTGCEKQNNSESTTETKEVNSTSRTNDKEFSSVEKNFDENTKEAVVTIQAKYRVINENGDILYEIEDDNVPLDLKDNFTYRNGLLAVDYDNTALDKHTSYIKDLKTGEMIVEGNDKLECIDVTQDGYILEEEAKEELGGSSKEAKIVDKSGKVIWSESNNGSEYFKVIEGNSVLYLDFAGVGTYKVIDAKTGKVTDLGFSCSANNLVLQKTGKYALINDSSNDEKHYFVVNTEDGTAKNVGIGGIKQIINDKYVYAVPLYKEKGIYTMDGTLVKDLSEGGVKNIYYADNRYHIISDTNFYYTLNDNFDYINEPVKINEEYTNITPTECGVYFEKGQDGYVISSDKFKADQDITGEAKKLEGKMNTMSLADESGVKHPSGKLCFVTVGIGTLKLCDLSSLGI